MMIIELRTLKANICATGAALLELTLLSIEALGLSSVGSFA